MQKPEENTIDDEHYWERVLPITRVTVHTKLPGENTEEIIAGTVFNYHPRLLAQLKEKNPAQHIPVTPHNKLIEHLSIPLSHLHIEEGELERDQESTNLPLAM